MCVVTIITWRRKGVKSIFDMGHVPAVANLFTLQLWTSSIDTTAGSCDGGGGGMPLVRCNSKIAPLAAKRVLQKSNCCHLCCAVLCCQDAVTLIYKSHNRVVDHKRAAATRERLV